MSVHEPGALAVLLPVRLRSPSPVFDRSGGGVVFSARYGLVLLAVFVASVAIAQVQQAPTHASVPELLVKWTPLLVNGFLFNLVISFFAMLIGTAAGVVLGFARISLHGPVRGTSWMVVQFFRNAPWLVLLFFVMFLMPFEIHDGG